MRLIWAARAKRDLRDQVDFLARDRVNAAIDVEDRVLDAVAGLVEYPHRGRVGQTHATREMPVRRTSLIVIYWLTDTDVEVLHIRHMAPRPFDGGKD